jgi:hypothetical protein
MLTRVARLRLLLPLLVVSLTHCSGPNAPGTASRSLVANANTSTAAGDPLRTGWYPDQPGLSPELVGSATFGRMFSTQVKGQVYAQPLLSDATLLVVTESNDIYGLDPESGQVRWTRNVGVPFNAADVRCGDLAPTIGVTGTPVIDEATHTAYFFSKTYTNDMAAWYAHAIDVASGAERPNFPVAIAGNAANDPAQQFVPKVQMQRPGLLLLDGVVYAAFGAHCDHYTRPNQLYRGWIAAVSTTGELKTLFTTAAGNNGFGAGIWQSGSGLVSDGPGQILFSTGNGEASRVEAPRLGSTPPSNLNEAVVRVKVQPDGTLAASDFFQPYDADKLDDVDADLGSGGPVALPSQYFGTPELPHLLVEVGKQGYVYLLNRDDLGGIGNGAGGGDKVIGRVGPIGQGRNRGVWGRPAVWPGDGGYLYMIPSDVAMLAFKYGLDGGGKPALSQVADSTQSYGYTSGSPVVTSDGTTSGSALVWVIGSGGGNGANGVLRAYDAVPLNGKLALRFEQAIGTASKFAVPGVGRGRIYVGTRDGTVIGFGSPVAAPISGASANFGTVVIGQRATRSILLTAKSDVTVTQIASGSAEFVVGAVAPSLPATLTHGQTLTVDVTFAPTVPGSYATNLGVTTPAGTPQVALTGIGQSPDPVLSIAPRSISFGGTAINTNLSANVILSNLGAAPLTIRALTLPNAPFVASGLPDVGVTIPSGGSITAQVTFAPTAVGTFNDNLRVDSNGGIVDLPLSGSAAPPGKLTIDPLAIDFGKVAVGESKSVIFAVRNSGGSALTINKSKPPALGPFRALSTLDEGTVLPAGATLVETVVFTPTDTGEISDGWALTASDGSGSKTVAFSGSGVIGGGLKGHYYGGANFEQLQLERVDPTIAFDWTTVPPDPSLPGSQPYSVRWSGQLVPKFSESYRLSVVAQDGVRLWIDNQLLIDQWSNRDPEEISGDIALSAGKAYDIKLEYYSSDGVGRAELWWASASQQKQIVPVEALRPGVPAPSRGGWQLNGSASLVGTTLQLTPAQPSVAGSAFWPGRVQSATLDVSFDLAIDSGGGADGLTLAFADARTAQPTALGIAGGGLGFSGIPGIALAFATWKNQTTPSNNFIGISDGPAERTDLLHWLTTATNIPPLRGVSRHVDVALRRGRLTVAIDGGRALDAAVTLPPEVFVGFTGATGGISDRHAVSNVQIR